MPPWPPEPTVKWCPLGVSDKSLGTRHIEMLPYRRYWHSGVWQMQSTKIPPVLRFLWKALEVALRCMFN